jgi:hypothetical protein
MAEQVELTWEEELLQRGESRANCTRSGPEPTAVDPEEIRECPEELGRCIDAADLPRLEAGLSNSSPPPRPTSYTSDRGGACRCGDCTEVETVAEQLELTWEEELLQPASCTAPADLRVSWWPRRWGVSELLAGGLMRPGWCR